MSEEVNFDTLLRFDGNDQVKMHAALRGWMGLAQEQRALLWKFYNLSEVLTVQDVPRVESALMIIRQLRARVASLVEQFALTPCVTVLQSALETLDSSVDDAEKYAKWVLSFYYERNNLML
ncbi:hypothetical protein [Stutzerimonas decontaminans]|nr:hypothetical protein [Stutzerimonas decontaminans]